MGGEAALDDDVVVLAECGEETAGEAWRDVELVG